MSAISEFISQIGSAVAVALTVSVALLRPLLRSAIDKTTNSTDLRRFVRYGLVAVFAFLGVGIAVAWLAYKIVSADSRKPADEHIDGHSPAPQTTSPLASVDEYPSNSPNYSSQNDKPPGLQSPPARIGTSETSNGE